MNKSLAIDTSTTRLTIACENDGDFYESEDEEDQYDEDEGDID